MRRVVHRRPLAPVAVAAQRTYWDAQGSQQESLFMDRKDLAQMYPTRKPRVTGGQYGYNRSFWWNITPVSNCAKRFPTAPRPLNPKPAEIITVYGATGYLGSRVVQALLENPGIKMVRCCTRYPTLLDPKSDLGKILDAYPDRTELHEADVTDRIQVNVAANGADTLIHCVDYHSEYVYNSHMDVFVKGASNVAWTARAQRSERCIYVTGLDATFASEANYVDMRARAEDAVHANFPDATVIRFGPLYGAGYRYRGLGRFLYPVVWGATRCQPTWVTDAARAVARAARSQRAVRTRLDLGGPDEMSHADWARKFSAGFHRRLTVPFWKGWAIGLGKAVTWVLPNPWFCDGWVRTWELDQVNRPASQFERLYSWEHIAYRPHTMEEAAAMTKDPTLLPNFAALEAEHEELEKADKAAAIAEEEEAKKKGLIRGVANPSLGRSDGMEELAREIYPGGQFRVRPLADAEYPSNVKNPFPVGSAGGSMM